MSLTRCCMCGSPSELFYTVTGDRSCGRRFGVPDPVTTIGDVQYNRCETCGHVWTAHFHHWSASRFEREIYNREYPVFDPGFLGARGYKIADGILSLSTRPNRILDYGAGQGFIEQVLASEGVEVVSFDPFAGSRQPPTGKFDLILCIEVLEHCVSPREDAQFIQEKLDDGGVLIVTTLVGDAAFDHDHWWLAPRNGHIHGFSDASIRAIFPKLKSFSDGVHYCGDVSGDFLERVETALFVNR